MFEGMCRIPSYSKWLLHCDMEPAYRYHRRVLKLLQWRCPPDRWWLKSPAHMLSIDALNAVYPDAQFVMTHRDVGKVLPSVCALYSTLTSVLTTRPTRWASVNMVSKCGARPWNDSSTSAIRVTKTASMTHRSRQSRGSVGQVARLYQQSAMA